MFRAELGYFQSPVAGVHHFLRHAFHFVAEHYGVFLIAFGHKVVQRNASLHLFQGINLESGGMQLLHRLHGRTVMLPFHGILSPEGRFVYLGMRRTRRDTAQTYKLGAESVGRAENGTYVVHTAHIVEHNGQRRLYRSLELLHVKAVQLGYFQLSHNRKQN